MRRRDKETITTEERVKKLKCLITCMKCEVQGHACNDNCVVQYNLGTTRDIIENLEEIVKVIQASTTIKHDNKKGD